MNCVALNSEAGKTIMATAKIGDILEIVTVKGRAYAQYTHENKLMGGLIRVFEKLHDERPVEFRSVVNGKVRFSTFLPVRQAIKQRISLIVDNMPIAPANQTFPLFRANGLDPNDWWLWDGENEWRIGALTPAHEGLPIREVCNDTYIIDRIEHEASND